MDTIGYIYADIAGDTRYSSVVRVDRSEDGDVTVTRRENGAVGGMDGPGGSYDAGVWFRSTIPAAEVTPKGVLAAVRSAFDVTVIRYGKPTKRFKWTMPDHTALLGLSQAKVTQVLRAWTGESQ